ncbi:Non-specific lipid-transfer protein-like protein [Striga hermonthica]|uniref:Non-specific lipid-transfer protein-like protein n=1 Tax=Striga hermonthica TaxID=68872 RepID=A0A9N7R3W4_STRHE|nr:Non-specific lipid-transfer protein-like protein [Striga hermonthica]
MDLRNCALVLSLLIALSAAKNHSPAPAVDCSEIVVKLADCLSYVAADNTTSVPSASCCHGLTEVLREGVETGGRCLCESFKSSRDMGLDLNMANAVALPSACRVYTFSVSNCRLGPARAPLPAYNKAVPPSPVHQRPLIVNAATQLSPSPSPAISGSSLLPAASLYFSILTVSIAMCLNSLH